MYQKYLQGKAGEYVRERIQKELKKNPRLRKLAGSTKKSPATVEKVLKSEKASRYFFNPVRFKKVLTGIQRQVNKGNLAIDKEEGKKLSELITKASGEKPTASTAAGIERLNKSIQRIETEVTELANGVHFAVNEEIRDIVESMEAGTEFLKWSIDEFNVIDELDNFKDFISVINPLQGSDTFIKIDLVEFPNSDKQSYFKAIIA